MFCSPVDVGQGLLEEASYGTSCERRHSPQSGSMMSGTTITSNFRPGGFCAAVCGASVPRELKATIAKHILCNSDVSKCALLRIFAISDSWNGNTSQVILC